MAAATIGLIFDLRTSQGQGALAKALLDFPNEDFRSGVQSAKENQMKFIIAAGRLDLANGGIVLVLAQDEDDATLGFRAANRRLAEYGVTSTHWVIAGDADLQHRTMKAAQSSGKGAT